MTQSADSDAEQRQKDLEKMLSAERYTPSIGRIQDEYIRKLLEDGTCVKDPDAAKTFAKYVASLKKYPVDEIKLDKDGNITGGVYKFVDGKYRIDEEQAKKAGLDGEMYVNRLDAKGKAIVDLDGNPVVDVIIFEKGVITNVIKAAPEDPTNPNLGACCIHGETVKKGKEYQENLAKDKDIPASEQSTAAELPRAKAITDTQSLDTINKAMIDEQGPSASSATGRAFRETVGKAVGIGEGIKLVPSEAPGKFKLDIPTDFNGVAVVPHLDEHGKPKPGDDKVDVISIKDGVVTNGLIAQGSSLDDGTRRAVAKGAEVEARKVPGLSEVEIARRVNVAAGHGIASDATYLDVAPNYEEPESIYAELEEPIYEVPGKPMESAYEAPDPNAPSIYDQNKESLYDNVEGLGVTTSSASLRAALDAANEQDPIYDRASPAEQQPTYDLASPEPIYDIATSTEQKDIYDLADSTEPTYDLASPTKVEIVVEGGANVAETPVESTEIPEDDRKAAAADALLSEMNMVTDETHNSDTRTGGSATAIAADRASKEKKEAEERKEVEENLVPDPAPAPDDGKPQEGHLEIPGMGDQQGTGPKVSDTVAPTHTDGRLVTPEVLKVADEIQGHLVFPQVVETPGAMTDKDRKAAKTQTQAINDAQKAAEAQKAGAPAAALTQESDNTNPQPPNVAKLRLQSRGQ
jgi:hypothetical protein